MWYLAGAARRTCYAVEGTGSGEAGTDVKAGTNIVRAAARFVDKRLDQEKDPKRRFKMFRSCSGGAR